MLVYILTTQQFPCALSKTRTVATCVIISIKECFMQNLYVCFLLHTEFHAPLLCSLLIIFKIYVCLRGLLGRNVCYYQHSTRLLVSQDLFLLYAFLNKDAHFFFLTRYRHIYFDHSAPAP